MPQPPIDPFTNAYWGEEFPNVTTSTATANRTFNARMDELSVKNTGSTNTIYVHLNKDVTTIPGAIPIAPGDSFTFENMGNIASVWIFTASSTSTALIGAYQKTGA